MTTAAARRRYRELGAADAVRSLANIREAIASTIPVESRSRPGHFHEVRVALDGALICPCPAGMNQLHCWHQDEARRQMATQTSTAVAIRQIELRREVLLPSDKDIERCTVAAKMFVSGAVALPEGIKNQAQVVALMLYGLELGLAPMTAMAHLYIVNGKVAKSAEVMNAMFMKAEAKGRILVEKLDVQHGSSGIVSGICTLRIIRPSREIDQRITTTWDQIKRAGLARDNNLKYPEDRLRYHGMKRLFRLYAPDITNALVEPQIATLPATYGIEGAPAALMQADDDDDSLYNEGDDEGTPEAEWAEIRSGVDVATGEVIASTDAQRKAVKELWPILMADKPRLAEIRGEYPRIFPQPGPGATNSINELTFEEAKAILLKYCDHAAEVNEQTTLLTCGKCGSVLEDGPPDAVQSPALPI